MFFVHDDRTVKGFTVKGSSFVGSNAVDILQPIKLQRAVLLIYGTTNRKVVPSRPQQ